jgi:transposase
VPLAAWTARAAERQAGRVARLQEAQRDWREPWELVYHSRKGLSQLFKRPQTKLKTGRRRHRRADPAAQAAVNKALRPHPRPAARARRVGAG